MPTVPSYVSHRWSRMQWTLQSDATVADQEQWVADTFACVFACVGGLVRDGWVTPHGRALDAASGPARSMRAASATEIAGALDQGHPPEQLAYQLRELHAAKAVPSAILNKCFKWLRASKPEPARRMVVNGQLASAGGTHQGWCAQLHAQSESGGAGDPAYEEYILGYSRHWLPKARRARGSGVHDYDLLQAEVARHVHEWDTSVAVPPDLLPRAAFQCGYKPWDTAVWLLQRLVGPGGLAVRPWLWRWAPMVALHKRGDPRDLALTAHQP